LVFATQIGRPLDGGQVNHRFHSALAAAGLPDIRVHDLRHTAATLLLTRGVHPKVVQEMLGHSTITLTLDTYSHVAPALHREVAAHMEALFGSIS
jgi:integrase